MRLLPSHLADAARQLLSQIALAITLRTYR